MSHRYRISYAPKALEDLRGIYTYIAFTLKSLGTAKKQVGRIRKEIRSLDFMPARYAMVDWEPWLSMKMHKMSVDNYVIYYTIDVDAFRVTVVRIVYGGRDIQSIAGLQEE